MLSTVSGQAHHLRSSSPLAEPGYVLRQLWMQAAELDEDRLAGEFHARLRTQPDPGLIPIWTTRRASRALSAELGRHEYGVAAVAVLGDGRVVSGGDDGRPPVWDPSRPGGGPLELGGHDGWVNAVAVLGDGRVVSGGDDGRLLVWDRLRAGGAVRSSWAATTGGSMRWRCWVMVGWLAVGMMGGCWCGTCPGRGAVRSSWAATTAQS